MTDIINDIDGLKSDFEDDEVAVRTLDRIAGEIDSLRYELAKQRWQPIETAPKDGTVIICAAIGHSNRFDGDTMEVIEDQTPRVWWASSGWWSDKYGRFWDGLEPSGFASLSHWMPLPEPPKD